MFRLLLVASLATLVVSLQGQSITYLNPFPTSLKLYDVAFPEPNVVCISGDYGLILRSTDNGQSFDRISSGTEATLSRLQFFDNSRGVASGPDVIRGTSDGGKSWFPVSTPPVAFLTRFFFTSPGEGWAATFSTLYHTQDGGLSWNIALETPVGPIQSLYFISPQSGWVAAGNLIFRTSDGGQNWEEQTIEGNEQARSVFFLDENRGWLATLSWKVYTTTDGGATWTPQFTAAQAVSSIHFSDNQHGVVACAETNTPALLYWTADGGSNWSLFTPGEAQELESVRLDANNTFWTVGGKGAIFRSSTNGSSWERLSEGTTVRMGCSYWPDNTEGWAFGDGGNYLHTTDGGGSWEQDNLFSEEHFFDLMAFDPDHIWVVGYEGVMFRTTDGGENWIYTDNGFDNRNMNGVDFVDTNTGYIVGNSGLILKSTDGGAAWEDLSNGQQAFYAVDFVNRDTGWISGFGRFLRTTDGGQSWQFEDPGTSGDLWGLFFLNEQTGWGVGTQGAIVKTTDGGSTWQNLSNPDMGFLRAVHFLDESFGVVAGDTRAYLTKDGGLSWMPTLPLTDLVDDVYIVDSNNIYVTGTDGTIARLSPLGLAKVSGFVFHDENGNGIRDAGEEPLPEQIITIGPLGFGAAANDFGYFQTGISEAGSFTATFPNPPPYTSLTTPASYDFQVVDFLEAYAFKFELEIQPGIQDLQVELITTEARPGFECTYFLRVQNIGTETIFQPVVQLAHDAVLTPLESSFPFEALNATLARWQFDSLQRWESQDFSITFQVENDIGINGMELVGIAEALPLDSDHTPETNRDTARHVVVSSYDPNDKLVEPAGMGDEGRIPLETAQLEYTIRFQNTGTASAINVVLRDTLDPEVFEISSLEMLAASHDYILRVDGPGIVEWAFPNIHLPFEEEDEAGSQGAVKFRIGLQPGLVKDTRIENRAGIYFDFNPPIITNTTLNTLGLMPNAVREGESMLSAMAFPIPFNEELYFDLSAFHGIKGQLSIYSAQGQLLSRQAVGGKSQLREDTRRLAPGIYFYDIREESGRRLFTGRLVKCRD